MMKRMSLNEDPVEEAADAASAGFPTRVVMGQSGLTGAFWNIISNNCGNSYTNFLIFRTLRNFADNLPKSKENHSIYTTTMGKVRILVISRCFRNSRLVFEDFEKIGIRPVSGSSNVFAEKA